MLTTSLTLNKEKWKPTWNKALVFLFVATYFLDGITRYKHLIVILMISPRFIRSHAHRKVSPLFSKIAYFIA
ncbi:Oligosaccharide repeat unit polymerase Wzy, O-antigen ligase [Salmonella enterica subsp. enterica serovar Sanjuan]|uniref:Oligosaccharide repeat unit polymerase Wzy, O-antigen ligase n=1 Tax=Salmonella enterica subsp. enterica serovar Sanjuan TaxID=1160765 RepID=A0A3S4IKD8_SALET|nr:Oligosaccharide repeat unit polymerase Wzy, O-antigen ligase [Salmonella enterica subsp. enterica serovar Sanjuan]